MKAGLPAAILFDLDGTLIDSAPDLAGAANDLRRSRGMDALPLERLRPRVGMGARGMIAGALDLHPGDDGFDAARDEFLARYERRSLRLTAVFADMVDVLARLDAAALPWGIVTNKAERLTHPIVEGLGLQRRARTVVCGDTTPHAKPHPAPLLEAARQVGIDPRHCLYVGDDPRDVIAGQAAGMATAAAAWGYLGVGEPIAAWGAGTILEHPRELLVLVGLE